MANFHNSETSATPNLQETTPRLTRRRLIQAGAALFTGAITLDAVNSTLMPWLMTAPERKVDPSLKESLLANDFELGPLGQTRTEYAAAWPNTRIWVMINNLLAAEKLNGLQLIKGQEYSLIDLLDLNQNYEYNVDPKQGYIVGLRPIGSRPPFISTVESQGLSLTATGMGRALATAPVHFNEFNTHTDITSATMSYFDPKQHLYAPPAFQHLGTDATVYAREEDSLDLRFTPYEDMTLKYALLSETGKPLEPYSLIRELAEYPLSLTTRFTKLMIQRVMVGCDNLTNYQIQLQPTTTTDAKGTDRPGFKRTLTSKDNTVRDEFAVTAYYNTHGKFVS